MPTLDFWYEFASTYSYLSAMRIREAGEAAGVEIRWKPLLLGPIFKANGWDTSPFNLFPAKGRYMVQDVTRIAAARDIPFRMPQPFPQNSLYAARIAVIAAAEGWGETFSMHVYKASFGEGRKIDDPAVLAECIRAAGQDPQALLPRISEEGIKNLLKAFTAQAQALGVFGAPSFVTGEGALFWGDDRLDAALAQAKREEEARKAREERAKARAAREADPAQGEADAQESESAAVQPSPGSGSPARQEAEAGPGARPEPGGDGGDDESGDAPAQPNGAPEGRARASDAPAAPEPDSSAGPAGEKSAPQ